jgi:hypothetical protein
MAKNKSHKYQFDNNLNRISVADNIEEVKKEWILITECIKDGVEKRCICNHKIYAKKYIILNIKNSKCAFVGDACKNNFCKKIGKKGNKPNQLLQDFIINEYENITNLKDYCFKVEKYLIEYLKNLFQPIQQSFEKLKQFEKDINDLMRNYTSCSLVSFKKKILKQIAKLEQNEKMCNEIKKIERRKGNHFLNRVHLPSWLHQQDDARRKEEEARRKEEEGRRKARRKEEEARRKEEEEEGCKQQAEREARVLKKEEAARRRRRKNKESQKKRYKKDLYELFRKKLT